MIRIETTIPQKTIMYGPPEGACVSEIIEPIQIHVSGITVQSESAATIIVRTTIVAASELPTFLVAGPELMPLHTIAGMSGHSKWASIKHKKAVVDARRGQQFTKLARAITVAAREGGGDAEANPSLATAVQKARDASMPKDNIKRAIDRGTGEGADAAAIERVNFEGYGPGGVAVLVETLSDNRNRTTADVRHAFTTHGGSLGEPGSVGWIFERRGVVVVDGERYGEDDVMAAIDAGAEDVQRDGNLLRVISDPAQLRDVRAAIEGEGVQISSFDLVMEPKNTVELGEADAGKLLRLLDALDEFDDVSEVHANFDISDEILERAAA